MNLCVPERFDIERTEDRKGRANGFKPRAAKTHMGENTLAITSAHRTSLSPLLYPYFPIR
jgi:hypothetical protein